MRSITSYSYLLSAITLLSCGPGKRDQTPVESQNPIKPIYVTSPVAYDSDDPAIWINSEDISKSLIIGTDKIEKEGGLYVFDLEGRPDSSRTVRKLDRPNNVDVAYGFVLGKDTVDIAVCTERGSSKLRVFKLPDMVPIDDGGIDVFENEELKSPMGIALYTRPSDNVIFAMTSRKVKTVQGESIWQYQLYGDSGMARGKVVRKFGISEGEEVEAIAVDNELGFVYYSDETIGVRKYHADPDLNDNEELAFFGQEGFAEDHEGISIYKSGERSGFILVSDQGANEFHVFPREGAHGDPHAHNLLRVLRLSTESSDGSDVTNLALNGKFPKGMFVAMSDDKTFQIYSWEDLIE